MLDIIIYLDIRFHKFTDTILVTKLLISIYIIPPSKIKRKLIRKKNIDVLHNITFVFLLFATRASTRVYRDREYMCKRFFFH